MAIYLPVSNMAVGNRNASISLTIPDAAYKMLVFTGAGTCTTTNPNDWATVKWNGTDLTKRAGVLNTAISRHHRGSLWYLLDPESGAYNVTVTFSTGTNFDNVHTVYCLTGVKQQALGATAENKGSATGGSMGITTVADDWAIDVWNVYGTNIAMSEGAGQTEIQEGYSAVNLGVNGACSYEAATGTTTTMSYDWATTRYYAGLGSSVSPQPMGANKMILMMSEIYDRVQENRERLGKFNQAWDGLWKPELVTI